MTRRIYHILGIFMVFCFIGNLSGQTISSEDAIIDTITYPSNNEKALVFIFNSDETGVVTSGMLSAVGPNPSLSYTFTWEKFNPENFLFETIHSETVNTSTRNYLEEGGYRIIVNDNGSFRDTMQAWIFINNFSAEMNPRYVSENGYFKSSAYSCTGLNLNALAPFDSLVYYDIYDSTSHVLYSEVETVNWDVFDKNGTAFPEYLDKNELSYFATDPLFEDYEIRLTVYDKYGAIGRDTAQYVAIRVHAEIEPEAQLVSELEPQDFYAKYYNNNEQLSAPQAYLFKGIASSKVDSFVWKPTEDTTFYSHDTLFYVYQSPGTYTPTLTVINTESGCEHSIEGSEIEIPEADFEMPNAFLLNGNNIFRSFDVSITDFEIVIFTRQGKKVHEFSGNIRDWKGWNGKIRNTDQFVKTGVYYYSIKDMTGKKEDGKSTHFIKKVKTGFFYVFNYE